MLILKVTLVYLRVFVTSHWRACAGACWRGGGGAQLSPRPHVAQSQSPVSGRAAASPAPHPPTHCRSANMGHRRGTRQIANTPQFWQRYYSEKAPTSASNTYYWMTEHSAYVYCHQEWMSGCCHYMLYPLSTSTSTSICNFQIKWRSITPPPEWLIAVST